MMEASMPTPLDLEHLELDPPTTEIPEVLAALIGNVDEATLQAWREELEWLRLSNGDIIFRQGEAPDGMYVVLNGRLRVMAKTDAGGEQTLAEITPGETVGEFALLTGEPRSATVYAVRETYVAKISTATFQQLGRVNPDFMTEITKKIVTRQQRLLNQGKAAPPTALSIALIPAGPSVDVKAFALELADALDTHGATAALDTQGFDDRFGKERAAGSLPESTTGNQVATLLDGLEAAQAYVLYAADSTNTAWTKRCLDRADRVLVIADPNDDPKPGVVEQRLAEFEIPVRTELVLWHPAETKLPSGTAAWLDLRDLFTHHHVRKGDRQHVGRLARRLTGQAIAFLCSGGGALGYAEMGVFRALAELDIPIDYVGGTSMGSIITGGVACGYSYDEMEEHAHLLAKTGVMDLTLPLAALTASKNVTNMLHKIFGDYAIEDLWIPFFCVSTNFSLAEKMVHRRGPLWRGIRASMSVPGIFLPVVEDGNVLVDGGLIDNFPVGIMVQLSESNNIVGVHISPYKEQKDEFDYDTSLSGWRILWNRINPFRKPLRVPALLPTLARSSMISGIHMSKSQEALVDLMITPDVQQFGFSDYDKWKELAEVGYEASLESLRNWKTEHDMA